MEFETALRSRVSRDGVIANSAAQAFAVAADCFVEAGAIPKELAEDVARAFERREASGSTSMGAGMLIPHIFVEGVLGTHLAVIRVPEGVQMPTVDGLPARLLFCILASEADRPAYLHVLGTIARVARDRDWRRHLDRADQAERVLEILSVGEKALRP